MQTQIQVNSGLNYSVAFPTNILNRKTTSLQLSSVFSASCCRTPLTFITQVEFGQVVSIVRLFIHGAVLPLFIRAQIHGLVLHLLLTEEEKIHTEIVIYYNIWDNKGADDKFKKK